MDDRVANIAFLNTFEFFVQIVLPERETIVNCTVLWGIHDHIIFILCGFSGLT